MAKGPPGLGLALHTFGAQTKHRDVPPQLRGAARRILQNSGTSADIQAIRSYFSLKETDPHAVKAFVSQLQLTPDRASNSTTTSAPTQSARDMASKVDLRNPVSSEALARELTRKDAKFARIFATRIQAINTRYGGISAPVLESAALAKHGIASYSDLKTLSSALGIKQGGGTALMKSARADRSSVAMAAQFGTFLNLAERGGVEGMLGKGGTAVMATELVERFTKNKIVRQAVESVAARYFGGALRGSKLLSDVGRYARLGSGLADKAAPFLAYAKAAVDIVELGTGNYGGEGRRLTESHAAIARADSRSFSYERRKLAALEAAGVETEARVGKIAAIAGTAVGAFFGPGGAVVGGAIAGTLGSAIVGRKYALQTGRLQNEIDAFEAGGGIDPTSMRALARERMLTDRYGWALGNTVNAITPEWLGLQSSIKGVTAKAAESLKRRQDLRTAGFDSVKRGEWAAAAEYLKQSKQELPQAAPAWENPAAIWTAMESARTANRIWARTQMARAGPRIGD